MDLRQLRYFVAVAEELSFSAGARRLGISQPPLTRGVQALETELGHELFTRDTRNVRLTAAGEAFLPEARKTLAQAQLAIDRSHAAARGESGVLRIGYFGSSIYAFLPAVLRRLRTDAPELNVSMQFMSKAQQVEALRERTLDIGFGHFYSQEAALVTEVLGQERLFVGTPADGPLATAGDLALLELADEPMLLYPREGRPNFSDDVVRIFGNAGVSLRVKHIANDAASVLGMVAGGMGSAIVPRSVLKLAWPGVRFVPLESGRFSVPITCIYRAEGASPASASLLSIARLLSVAAET